MLFPEVSVFPHSLRLHRFCLGDFLASTSPSILREMKDTEPNDAPEASRMLLAFIREEFMEVIDTLLRLPQLGR